MRLDNSIFKRWRATQESPRYAETGFQRFQRLCCGARLASLTFLLATSLSSTGRGKGERGGWREITLETPYAIVHGHGTCQMGNLGF